MLRNMFAKNVDMNFSMCSENALKCNKIDLEDKREILEEEGLKKAEDLRCSFIETSTLHNINVQDTFKIVGIGLLFKFIEETENLN